MVSKVNPSTALVVSKHAVLAAIITLGLAPVCGYPSDWKVIEDDTDSVIYVDAQSIAQTGSYVKAWFMVDFKKPQKNANYPSKVYKSFKNLDYFNCSARSSAWIQGVYYSGQLGAGDPFGQEQDDPSKVVFQDVIPDSNGEIKLDYVCAAVRAKQSPPIAPKK